MKTFYLLLAAIAFCLFSSFSSNEACNYAGSNMNFVKTQTEKALIDADINKARFLTYKAIKAIQGSNMKFDDCGCKDAEVSISESLINLKAATRSLTLSGTRVLLNESLEHIIDAIDALEQHAMHDTAFSSKEFAMNTTLPEENLITVDVLKEDKTEIQQHIDTSLLKYETSLNMVIKSVNCTDARAFADKIFKECEQQLLKAELSEGRKYYNLRTKEITAKALEQLGECIGLDFE